MSKSPLNFGGKLHKIAADIRGRRGRGKIR